MATVEGPDQKSAWVVAFAACIINMILSGISRMIGMLYVAVIDTYGVSRAEATLPFTVRNSIRCLSGPLVGVIGQRYGVRTVTLCGGVIATLGATLCSVAPSVLWLTILWGGIHGLGFAFANTLFQVVVNQYFEKYRATASGIALSGACLGSLGFPFMMEAFLENFGLSGTFLILGGVIMNVLPAAAFLRAPPWLEKGKQGRQVARPVLDEASRKNRDLDLCHPDLCNSTSMSNNLLEGVQVLSVRRLTISENILPRERHQSDEVSNQTAKPTSNGSNGVNTSDTDSVHEICKDAQDEVELTDGNTGCLYNLIAILKLYKNPVYILINVCMSTYVIIFVPNLTVIVDYGQDKGFPASYGKFFINSMAFGDLIGRMCFGWITDRGLITIPRFMTLTLVAQGAIIALFPHAMTMYGFVALLILYGMAAGSILVLFPILVLKYVSVEDQAVAMGCVGFLSGVISFGIPPLIGHFRDNVGSYDGMFYITGGISLITGGLWLLEPILAKIYHRKQIQNQS